jgi:protein ImuA
MRWVTAHHKGFSICDKSDRPIQWRAEGFVESITPGGVHELLFEPGGGNAFPLFPALLTAGSQVKPDDSVLSSKPPRTLAWVDATGSFYPPAAMGAGILPGQICLLQPQPADLVWATIESLRCRSMGAVVALMMQPLTRVEVRRLQLAAEAGGGIAVLIRPNLASAASHIYAAATRWLVTPAPGERTIQRWHLQLVHGHGRRLGQTFILEKHRATGQTHIVHLSPPLADHPKISAAS